MTKEHLIKIIQNSASGGIERGFIENGFFSRLYEPEYFDQPIDEYKMDEYFSKALCFDYRQNDFVFISGSLSCTGLVFKFKSERFEQVTVNVFYDCLKRSIYNSVLAQPKYTENDWKGKKRIQQSANKIENNTDIKKYIKRLYKRFECPLLS
ncbi:hypothetical protein J2810_004608 [Chryseobacterium rhizosphaerae]|uniref:hypothetical protein n=1 Tax=Chryseobacterium rhizosphaerae TaxID=395937 RepID=UPI00286724D2|nr:hypothetical protein [Chryseobacterium rhizosphaerae]MDR6548518.1 hypothetical protein [Chryseobacterium rhizosphaerae]